MIAVGMCLNMHFIIFANRINPFYLATALELCFCIANIVAATAPIFGKMPQPVPVIAICFYCIIGLTIVSSFGWRAKTS
mgnify:CR=1 FL=1